MNTLAEAGWRWVCRVAGALLLGLLVLQEGFQGPLALYFLFAALMTLGDVIAEAMRLRRNLRAMEEGKDPKDP